jgi:hypothetical protein
MLSSTKKLNGWPPAFIYNPLVPFTNNQAGIRWNDDGARID